MRIKQCFFVLTLVCVSNCGWGEIIAHDCKEVSAENLDENKKNTKECEQKDDEVAETLECINACTRKRKFKKNPLCQKFASAVSTFVHDAIDLHINLVSWTSFQIIATTFPFYISARMIDEKLQNCFYDERHHKNKGCLPEWCETVSKLSISIPIVFLGTNVFFSDDEDLRTTSRIFLIGMPFVIWTKDIIKKFEADACLRPWNEHFSCEKRAFGGFPSGHMAEITYTAFLFGMRYGPSYAVPLGTLAGVIGISFLSCNRHYLSQLVAGAGFGAMYAYAANKLIDTRLHENIQLCMNVNSQGGPAVQFTYTF